MSGLMSARLRDYRMLWRAAVTHANPRLSRIVSWGVAFLVIVIGAAVAGSLGPRAGLAWFWCAASGILLLHWAWRFMPGAVKLNSPANAQLVPQMRRRLVELSWLLCCIGVAGIASAPYTNTSHLGTMLSWVVAFVVVSGLGMAGHRATSAFIIAASICSLLVDNVPVKLGTLLSHPAVVVLSLPVYAGVIFLAMRAMFPQGGERHWDMLARRARWASAAGKPDPLVEQLAGKRAKGWYAASLRRDSARRDSRRLVLHALGPGIHLGEFVIVLGYMAAIVAGIGILSTWRADPIVVNDLGWVFTSMLLVLPLIHCGRIGQLSGVLASEQALVRLAPAMPAAAAAFNRRLGRALLLQALVVWGMTAGAAVLLAALGGAGPEALLRVASLACLVLPVVAVPLRDHASRRRSAAAAAATLLLVSLVESLSLGMAVNAFTSMPVLPVAALVSIGFTIVVVARRLRAMRQAPCAFPAGRMD